MGHTPINNIYIRDLAKNPLRTANCFNVYFVNGCKFHNEARYSDRATMNSGVCINGSNYSDNPWDFYGRLKEILAMEYPGLPIQRTILFNCDWYDPINGTNVYTHYKQLVDVNKRCPYRKYEPFIIALQASQV